EGIGRDQRQAGKRVQRRLPEEGIHAQGDAARGAGNRAGIVFQIFGGIVGGAAPGQNAGAEQDRQNSHRLDLTPHWTGFAGMAPRLKGLIAAGQPPRNQSALASPGPDRLILEALKAGVDLRKSWAMAAMAALATSAQAQTLEPLTLPVGG